MRFHFGIGFSKKVKTSILFWLGLLFLIFSTIAIGSLEQVYASEVFYDTDLSSYFGTIEYHGFTKPSSSSTTLTSVTKTYTNSFNSNGTMSLQGKIDENGYWVYYRPYLYMNNNYFNYYK